MSSKIILSLRNKNSSQREKIRTMSISAKKIRTMSSSKRCIKQEPCAKKKKKKYEQSLAEDADELLGGSDSDGSASKDKLAYLEGNPCKRVRCVCFLCHKCLLVDKERLRYVMRKKDDEIENLKKEIEKLKSKK